MKRFGLLMSGLITLVAVSPAGVTTSGCDRCPIPRVGLYDFRVLGPKPNSGQSPGTVGRDFELLQAPGAMAAGLDQCDNNGCVQLYDGAIRGTLYSGNPNAIQIGVSSANLPPAGSVPGLDYLFEGQISGTEGAYHLSVSLEDATTREALSSQQASFATATEAADAGRRIAGGFCPLIDVIRAFQRSKRDAGDATAIHARLELTPARNELAVRDSTDVKVRLSDCDGQPGEHPLRHRAVSLQSTLGRFDPATVTTDAKGEAHARFTAGNQPGLAGLNGTYGPYADVTHHAVVADTSATVQIDDPPTGLWQIDGDCTYSSRRTSTESSPVSRSQHDESRLITVHFSAWVQARSGADGSFSTVPGGVVSFAATGELSGRSHQSLTEPGHWTRDLWDDTGSLIAAQPATLSFEYHPSNPALDQADFHFQYLVTQDHVFSVFTLGASPQQRDGHVTGRPRATPWSWIAYGGSRGTIERQRDGSFLIEYSRTVDRRPSAPQTGSGVETETVNATLRPVKKHQTQ